MSETYKFAIIGRIVPAARMTQNGMWKRQPKRYLNWKEKAALQFKTQMYTRRLFTKRTPLAVRIRISQAHSLRTSDLDNNIKALLDAAQGIVFEDDRDVHEIDAFRELGSGWYAEMEVEAIE